MKDILSLCERSGIKDPEIIRLKGDFSERIIYRVRYKNASVIAVSGGNVSENEAFLSFRETFQNSGFNVPEFIAVSEDHKTYLIGDLGDTTVKAYCDLMIRENKAREVKAVYKRIAEKLSEIQTALYDKIDYSKCYQSEVFDRSNMESDIFRFEEYFLKKYMGKYNAGEFKIFKDAVINSAYSQSRNYFMYRDFQTRNIMLKDGELYFIDFQSGRKGSFYYDLASFIYSSNTVQYVGIEDEISHAYYDHSGNHNCGYADFRDNLDVFALLRIMQAVGNYAYYYFIRNDNSINDKKEYGLRTIMRLSRNLNIEPGIYEG